LARPTVAIVGRPNVGKSTLFNRLAGQRIAIVEDKPGITRDRIYSKAEWLAHEFDIIDTGGIEISTNEPMIEHIKAQAELAIEQAQVIVFLVDGMDGITQSDRDVAQMLMRSKKAVIVAVNKLDNPSRMNRLYEFYEFGFEQVVGISSEHAIGVGDLLDEIVAHLPPTEQDPYGEDVIRIAVVGRPNVGKSSIVNAILGEERVLVSSVAGTTRDAIDTPFERDGQPFVIIDTAGMRKRGKVYESTERYSVMRAVRAIERSDTVLLVIDGHQGIIEQDKRIVGYALEAGKAVLLVVNKWDLVEKDTHTTHIFEQTIRSHFPFMAWAKIAFVSAKTKQRVSKILSLVSEMAENHAMRVSTSSVNTVLQDAIAMAAPPTDKGRKLRVLYGTQVAVKPPSFAIFVNDPELMHFSYSRYLENKLRAAFGFEGTPIRLFIRQRK